MRCAKCGAENPTAKRFCGDCGAQLANVCPRCGADNPAGKRFCGDCSAALSGAAPAVERHPHPSGDSPAGLSQHAASAPSASGAGEAQTDGERKTVTALFADIKGSTELEQDLDPEEARAIVDPALKLMIEAVRRYDGYVVQSTGDGIFALFGAPAAHEDHPQRALYAALRMQQELRRYSGRLVADGGNPLQCRVGINTGEVVVRSISTGAGQAEYTPIGHTTNLASRMQAVAPVGSIAVAEPTRKLCEGYFTLRPLGPTKVRGVSEAINVYEVTGLGPLRSRLQRSASRGYTKFVGRKREMDALAHAAAQAQAGHGQIVAAVADAGVGKSRLFYEFKVKNQSDWMVLEAFSVSHGKATAFLPVIDLLQSYFAIEPGDDARKRREKVAGRLAILDPSLEDARPYLFALLGIAESADHHRRQWEQTLDRLDAYLQQQQRKDPLAQMDAQVRRRRTLDVIKRILLRESLNQPLIVMFEDLHWIDEDTQALLNLLADSIGTARVLLLVNYRPEYSHSWSNKSFYTQLRLDPLGRENADEMVAALLGDGATESAGPLAALKRLVIDKTEGNPFFIEEIVQALQEEGALVRNGAAHLTKPVSELKIPPTVQGILAARIDRLPPAQKDLLQTLAVIGKEFPLALVRETVKGPGEGLNPMLEHLQLAEFIYEQPAAGDVEYTFKHALTQEVAYNSILTERRKALHERVGAALEHLHRDALDDHLGELAHHYGRSANLLKAIDYLGRAANQAAKRSLFSETLSYADRALRLLASIPDGDTRQRSELGLQSIKGVALMAVKGFMSEEVAQAFSRTRELGRTLNDLAQEFMALQGIWGVHYTRGATDAALQAAQESMALAQKYNEPSLLQYAHYNLGASLAMSGKLTDARAHLELAVQNTPGVRSNLPLLGPNPSILSITALSDVLFSLGYPDQSLDRALQALRVETRESDPFSFAMAVTFVAQAHCARGEGKRGEEVSRELIDLCDSCGFPFWLAFAKRLRSWAVWLQGRWEQGAAMMNQVVAEAGAGEDGELSRFYVLPFLAEAYGYLEKPDLGLEVLETWVDVRSRHPITAVDKVCERIRGELLRRRGSLDAAEVSLRHAIELGVADSARIEQLRATTSLARLLRDTDRRTEARAMLAAIYDWFTEGFDTVDLMVAKALLNELSS